MATQKVNAEEKDTKPVVINNCDYVELNKKNKIVKEHNKFKLIIKIVFIVLILLAISRAPYCGSYIDGLFDYLFGQIKYVFYAWGLFTLIAMIYNGRVGRIVRTSRYFILSILCLISLGCILSGIYDFIKYLNTTQTFTQRMTEYHNTWMNYFKNVSYSAYINTYISGGILAVMLSSVFNVISYLVLVIFAGVIFIICLFIIFNINYKSTKIGLKLRSWLVRKLGGSFKYDSFNELSNNEENQNKFKRKKKSEIESDASMSEQINFDLLPDTDINNDERNWKKAATNQAKLANLFKQEGIDCITSDINIYTSYSEICFEAKSNSDIKEICKIQEKISKAIKLDKFNISFRGNILSIDYDNLFFSKLSLKSVSKLFKRKEMTSFFGIDKNKKIVTHDFKLSPTALIVGQKGSGSATLLVLMMLSICFCTKPEDLDLVVLNPNAEQTYTSFNNMPHTSGKLYESINAVTDKLHELQSIVNQRMSLLTINHVDNIEQFNKISNDSTSRMKSILVVMPNVENAIKETFQNSKIIEELVVNGPKVGLYVVLQSYRVNSEILEPNLYQNITDKYILSLEDQGESIKIFDNYRGSQLHLNGDCLHFEKDKVKTMERIQVCNINKTELATVIDIVKTYYSIKKEEKQIELLDGGKQDEQKII